MPAARILVKASREAFGFRSLATKVSAAKGQSYDDRRWHTAQGDLLVHEGQTFTGA